MLAGLASGGTLSVYSGSNGGLVTRGQTVSG